ncbi:MAG: ATP-binding cassette domain-containing protein [Vampirovibrionales bacterium]|nr:ATP-binding cassette domain-containing protein [Vampirovibrionales bacterium]
MAFTLLKTDIGIYRRMLGYLGPFRKRFILAMLASLPVAGVQGLLAWMVGPFTDKLLTQQDFTMLYAVPAFLIGVTIAQGVCQYINEYNTSYIGQSVTQTMRADLFRKLATMDLGYLKRHTLSDLLTRYCIDPAQLQQAINDNLQDLIVKIATIIGLACVLFWLNWQYAILSLVILSLMTLPISIISRKIRRMDHVTRAITSRLFVTFSESVRGYRVIKAYGLDGYQLKRYERHLRDYFSAAMRIVKAGIILKPAMQIISACGIGLVLALGVSHIQNGTLTPGGLTSFIVSLGLLISPIKTVGSAISKMQRIMAPAERVFEKMDLDSAIADAPDAVSPEPFETLRYENVHFEYEAAKPVLNDISFTVRAGETVAFVGGSGGGKTTMMDLIPRFIDPTAGRVLLNERDLRDLSLAGLRQTMAIVSQDAILFDGTIRENIAIGRLSASDAEIRDAMAMAYLSEWVDSLELGWDAPVGEDGCLLSGGQKQRVTIARAFLKNAPILILDEATSALDNESEAIVQQALANLLSGRTVLVIAHRLSTIRHADRILVVEKGRIIETGSHEALLAQNGAYHRLYHLQFRDRAETAVSNS